MKKVRAHVIYLDEGEWNIIKEKKKQDFCRKRIIYFKKNKKFLKKRKIFLSYNNFQNCSQEPKNGKEKKYKICKR